MSVSGSFGGSDGRGHTDWGGGGGKSSYTGETRQSGLGYAQNDMHAISRGDWSGSNSGNGSSYREGMYSTKPDGTVQTWTAVDGWHDVDTKASKPSYNGGLMKTRFGARNPSLYARDKQAFNIAQKRDRFNTQAGYMDGLIDQINNMVNHQQNWWTREPELEKQQLRNAMAKSAYAGDLSTLRDKFGVNTTAIEDEFAPSGWKETLRSWFGEKPDKVETFSKAQQDMVDKGLLEWNDKDSLELTNKGIAVGIGKMAIPSVATGITNLAKDWGGPLAAEVTNGVVNGAGFLATADHPSSIGSMAGFGLKAAAPYAAQYDLGLGQLMAGLSPVGKMYDTFSYGKKLDDLGIARGGKSYFQRDPNTGAVLSTNYDVVNNAIDQAMRSIQGTDSSEFYPQGISQTLNQLWPGESQQDNDLSLTYPQWWSMFG